MIPGRHRLLALFAIMGALTGSAAGDVRAQASGHNTWTTVAPLPKGTLWPAAASSAGRLYVFTRDGTVASYDPATNAWTPTGHMPEALVGILSATTGTDGRIYVYGSAQAGPAILVYDPSSNTWAHATPPPGVQDSAQLVAGPDGRIYAVGGRVQGTPVGAQSSYDPNTHAWTALAPDPTLRGGSSATIGPDGRIYVIGGDQTGVKVEAYDPRSNSWTPLASLPAPRLGFQAVTGPDGRIYVLGGVGRCFTAPCAEVEAYDVHTNTWTAVASMSHGRRDFTAAAGPDGRIYVLGGFITTYDVFPPDSPPTEVDAYTVVPRDQPLPAPPPKPTIATRPLASMPTGRYGLGAAASGEKIYAIGGQASVKPEPHAPTVFRRVEAYDPKTNTWAQEPPLPAPRVGMGVATGPDGRIYVLGGVATAWGQYDASGYSNVSGLRNIFIYNPKTRRWSQGPLMPDGRYALAAVTGKDGRIYTIGGATFCHADLVAVKTMRADNSVAARIKPLARPAGRPAQAMPGPLPQMPGGSCEGSDMVRAFNPRTNGWKTLAPLPVGGVLPAAAVAADGRIYVVCCGDLTLRRPSLEVYDPASNHWTEL
ncbi:MAG TPA: kelch repeat-containing protein, partial [Chloroflexota bacterium]